MASKLKHIDETMIQPPIIHVSKESPKKKADPKLVADVEAKLKKHHIN